jgi:hypothetical protein
MKRIIAIVSSLLVFGAAVFTGIQLHRKNRTEVANRYE